MRRKKYRRTGKKRGDPGRVILLLLAMAAAIIIGVMVLGRLQSLRQEQKPLMKYTSIIRECAAEYDLEPAYIAAIIMAESSYRPDVVSSADARGLMQLLPSTGKWISGKLGGEFTEEDLFDPETNVRYGAWYLNFLLERYHGSKVCASAAYHSGQGTVDEWLKNPEYSSDGVDLDVIASSVTNTYVNRVLKYYEQYKPLYDTI